MTSGITSDVGQMTVKLTSSVYWNKYNTQNVTEYTFDEVNIRIFVILTCENQFSSVVYLRFLRKFNTPQ